MDPEFVNKYNMLMNRVKQIENFDGTDPTKLPQFLTKIETIVPSMNKFDDYYKNIILNEIKAKCTDRAKEVVLTRSGGAKVTSWMKLKELLLHNYAEKESSYALIHKLRTAVLDTNIEQYYQKMSKLKQRVLNRKLTHNDTLYSVEDIERISLHAFRDHLPEPTHSMILRRNPKSMEEAYRYIVEVQQQFYSQSGALAGEQSATYSTSYKQTFGRSFSMDLQPGVSGSGGTGGTGAGLGGAAYARPLFAQSEKHAIQNKAYNMDYNKSKYGGSSAMMIGGAGKNTSYFGGTPPAASTSASKNGGSSSYKSGGMGKSGQGKEYKSMLSNNGNGKSAWRK